MAEKLSRKIMQEALAELARRDPDLARAHKEAGTPELRRRPAGFGTLLDIILAQQVSASAANAIRARLRALAEPLTPEAFLLLDDAALRAVGFSRQKVAYGRHLAEALRDRNLRLARVHRMEDEEAILALSALKGIGRWSAEVYLLFALRRPDIWPADDLAVVLALQRLKGLSERPNRARMIELAEPWRPWRSYAARLMWHYYKNAP
jgi:DNA-3-methyladenine glycosylase II